MKNPVQLTEAIDPIQTSLRPSFWRCRTLIISLACGLACFALLPTARAVDPPPDGGYPNTNTAEGTDALFNLTTGYGNTAIGADALYSNTDGDENTANGSYALFSNTTGGFNTANGFDALAFNTTGVNNTATGLEALFSNTTGSNNTANGYGALLNNTTASKNTATGYDALYSNSTGNSNTADGYASLYGNTIGSYNTGHGYAALYGNTTGSSNTANGYASLYVNTTGGNNTAVGFKALNGNTSGSNNIALGTSAGLSLTTGSYNIDIGNTGVAGEAKTIRIGKVGTQTNTYVAGIYGVTAASGVGVFIDSNGHLGTMTSSARFKEAIKPIDKMSEAILALQPVTFHYKHELDPEGTSQFGLIAEQVEKVNPDLVARDEQGKPYTVRYEAVNAMLLNEFLKEHKKVQEQEAIITKLTSADAKQEVAIAQQQKEIKTLTSTLHEQALQIQKVSAQLAVDRPAPRVVANDQSKTIK